MNKDLLSMFTQAYYQVKRRQREIAPSDTLEDLDVDSLDAIDLLSILEEGLDRPIDVWSMTGDLNDIFTVGDFLDRLEEYLSN